MVCHWNDSQAKQKKRLPAAGASRAAPAAAERDVDPMVPMSEYEIVRRCPPGVMEKIRIRTSILMCMSMSVTRAIVRSRPRS